MYFLESENIKTLSQKVRNVGFNNNISEFRIAIEGLDAERAERAEGSRCWAKLAAQPNTEIPPLGPCGPRSE